MPVLKRQCDSIANAEMLFEEDKSQLTLASLLKGTPLKCHLYIKRIPMSELPEDEREAEEFLYKMYEEKDGWAESFFKNKNFNEISEWSPIEYKPKTWIFVNQIFWMAVTVMPILTHFISLLLHGLYYNFLVKFGILFLLGKKEKRSQRTKILKFLLSFQSNCSKGKFLARAT